MGAVQPEPAHRSGDYFRALIVSLEPMSGQGTLGGSVHRESRADRSVRERSSLGSAERSGASESIPEEMIARVPMWQMVERCVWENTLSLPAVPDPGPCQLLGEEWTPWTGIAPAWLRSV